MTPEDATGQAVDDESGRFARIVSNLEVFGLNAARLILAVVISISVIFFVLGLVTLVLEGFKHQRATSAGKYRINSITYAPNFSNVRLRGRSLTNADDPLTQDRVAAVSKTRDQLVAERQASQSEAGVCDVDENRKCFDLERQKNHIALRWTSAAISPRLPRETAVSYKEALRIPSTASYYGSYGFGSEEDALKAEWDAVNSCLRAFKAKNGNLYYQKAPELFDAVAAQCDNDYQSALRAELAERPKDWTFVDMARVMLNVWVLVGLGSAIILIALTIIFFRLEVSFRALRNLNRLK